MITHHNITKYYCQQNEYLNVLNEVIKNNSSRYYMIMFDHYCFEQFFINKLVKELIDMIRINGMLIINY